MTGVTEEEFADAQARGNALLSGCHHPADAIEVDPDDRREGVCTRCGHPVALDDGGRVVDDEPIGQQPTDEGPSLADCEHPPAERRLLADGGPQRFLCGACWQTVEAPAIRRGDPTGATTVAGGPAALGPSRPDAPPLPSTQGAADPASGEGWLSFVDPTHYTPEQCEREVLVLAGRLNAGERYATAKAVELTEAQIAYDAAYARAIHQSEARSADQRKAEAAVRCEHEYAVLRRAEVIDKTTRSAMHTLRSQLSGLQSVLRSVSSQAGGR